MSNQGDSNNKATFSRLPANVVPVHYHVTIRPDLSAFTFLGNEIIDIEVRERTNTIVLNSLDIAIQSASFIAGKHEQSSTNINISKSDETATITFANALEVGSGQLKLQFTGEVNDLMTGCYRNKYTTPDGEVRYGLSTQFESVYCRRAFPCWDEPAIKAKFDLTLIVPKDRVALSNMYVVQETDDEIDPTKRVLKFATTPVMSTYLLCWVIGEYDFIEQNSKNGTKIRVYTPLTKTDQGKFALDVAVRCLDYYEDYFKISFPLPKLDLIALPDFKSGAMENWGLITYRQTLLLFDPQNSSSMVKQFIAIVVCHELAHQWFGNLVTMEWWSDLWLNEGFASFMEYLAVDSLLPDFQIWEQFITDAFNSALNLDALHNSHPIQVPVGHPSEIEEIFDQISYEKGASVIRMLYHYIGNEDFQKGMHQYLTKHAYKNAVTEDLWDSLEEASKKPIRSMMNTWTKQKGFPLISVTARQDGRNRVLTLAQEKFSINGVLTEIEQQTTWIVPISIISQNNPKPIKVLLEERSQEIVLENIEPNEWIKINPNMTGFYRVQYDELFELFQPSIVDKSLNTIDRINIQSDLLALVECGKVSSDHLLKLLESYVNEDKFSVWDSIISCLAKYNTLLAYTDFEEVFHLYARKLLAKIYAKVGSKPVQGEDHQVALLRTILMWMLVSCNDPQVIQDAKAQFESHASKLKLVAPDLRGAVYRAVVQNDCDDKTFESFFQMYRETDLQEEKNRLARSLGTSKDPSRIQRVIDFAMSSEVRNQDAIMVFVTIASTKVGREIAWNYFKENHNVFLQRYETGNLLNRLIKIVENFATEEHLQDVSAFYAANPIKATERAVEQCLESIKSNANWLSRDSLVIKKYLTDQL